MNRWRAIGTATAALLASTFAGAPSARGQTGDEHGSAEALITQVERNAAVKSITAQAVALAKDALERATRLRHTGDEAHAKAADGLALEWAQTARDLARAADAEARAAELRRKALDAQAQLERSRALVEEGIARVGRLRTELEAASTKPAGARSAVEVHDGDPPGKKEAAKKASRPSSGTAATGGTP